MANIGILQEQVFGTRIQISFILFDLAKLRAIFCSSMPEISELCQLLDKNQKGGHMHHGGRVFCLEWIVIVSFFALLLHYPSALFSFGQWPHAARCWLRQKEDACIMVAEFCINAWEGITVLALSMTVIVQAINIP